jgi:signal peptidase II
VSVTTSGPDRADADRGARRATWSTMLPIGIVVTVVALDQATKAWAVSALPGHPRDVVGNTVQLVLGRNSGSAFSMFTGITPVLAVLALGVAVVLARAVRRSQDLWTVCALSLVLGGALGNLSDRVFRSPGFLHGAVVDFVRLGWWPVFNVADSAITIGAILLVAFGWRTSRPVEDATPAR